MAINPKEDATIAQYDFSVLQSLQISNASLVDILASFTSFDEINEISEKFKDFANNNNTNSMTTSIENLEIKYNVTNVGKKPIVMLKFINNMTQSIVSNSEIGYSIKVDDKPPISGSTDTGKDMKVLDTTDSSIMNININITRYNL